MKMHSHIFTIGVFVAITFTTSLFIACGEDNTEPAPVTPPQEEPEKKPDDKQDDEEEDETEMSDTNYNISSIVFPIHRNAGLSETITIYPDENNVFTERVYSVKYDHTRPYMMPAGLTKLYVEFNSDAKTIYIDGVEYKKSSPYDFSKPVTVTACADTGTEKSYTIELKNFTGLPIIYINTASGQEVKDKVGINI